MWGVILVLTLLQLAAAHIAIKRDNADYNYHVGMSGEVRLMSPVGSTRLQPWGIVQARHNGVWGTVCQAGLKETTLSAICRDMLPNSGGYRVGDAEFPAGDAESLYGPATLENPVCSGTEANVLECQHQGLGNADCSPWALIKVQCYPIDSDEQAAGERIRLVDSEGNSGGSSGRFELMHNGVWGTVCNSYASTTPHFLCAKLGYTGGTVMPSADVPPISDVNSPIWAVGLSCVAPIERVEDCMAGFKKGYGVLVHGNCWGHMNDLGLVCEEAGAEEGTIEQEVDGSLKVFHEGVWWQVCSHSLGYAEAGVACRKLGQPGSEGTILPMSYSSSSGSIWLKDIECEGDEQSLVDCDMSEEQTVMCRGGPLRIQCGPVPDREPGREGEIQLIDGRDEHQGRVEIYHDGAWGTICEGGMGEDEAQVICSGLGYERGSVIGRFWETYGGREGTPIVLDNVNCTGVAQAETITDCRHTGWGQHSCERDQVVWVHCTNESGHEVWYDYLDEDRRDLPGAGMAFVDGKRRGAFRRILD